MNNSMEPISFKFKFVNATGHESGFLSSRGTLNENELVLDKTILPLGCIYQVIHRYSRLAVVYASDTGPATVTIAPRGMDRKLKETIDRLCSYRWAEQRHAQLEGEGKGAAFRTAKCRACTAVVDLTGFAETPQVYCPFCENLLHADSQLASALDSYRLCDRCRFYSHPVRFTATYVILNVVSWREHQCCHACMRRECWKMLLGNLLPPFVGELFAIGYTIRAYVAGSMDAQFPELVTANAYGHRSRVEQARDLYEAMLERVPVHAVVRYNLALAYARAGQWDDCLDAARCALADCANYQPAAGLVCDALVHLDRKAESEHFAQSWGMPASDIGKPATRQADREHIQARTPGNSGEGIREA
jgi:tetratricopeptide (TPR) repeat protein